VIGFFENCTVVVVALAAARAGAAAPAPGSAAATAATATANPSHADVRRVRIAAQSRESAPGATVELSK
jgi:hypothetical protein